MKKSLSTAMMALGALVLIFCIAFTVVQLVGSDYQFFEEEFIKLGLDSSMNMTIGDISKGLQALMEYMNGKIDSIDVDVMVNGVMTPMYVLDIEHIHMEEVREVWLGFDTARNLGFLLAALLVLGAFMVDNRNPLRNGAVGYLWALGTALVICLFLGVWASTNFNSFWTQFHKIIFPNSENWLLPSSSRMIQMLPGDLFQALVMRVGGIVILILVLLGIGAVAALVIPKRKAEKVEAAAAPEKKQEDTRARMPEQEAPDLVLMHKLLNMSVTRRKKVEEELMLEKLKAEAEAESKAGQQKEDETPDPETARIKIDFAAYEGEEPAPEVDEEEREEAEWLEALAKERKAKKAGKPKKSSSKKKKKSGEKKPKSEGVEAPVVTEESASEETAVVEEAPAVEEVTVEPTAEEKPVEEASKEQSKEETEEEA